ncbi:MAG: hypothetical protein V1809_15700 [Planctomycetota bacterium]
MKSAHQVIKAQEFRLVDSKGRMRASLGLLKDGPVLVMFDAKGRTLLGLSAFKESPGLVLLDVKGTPRVSMGFDSKGAVMELYDASGRLMWSATKGIRRKKNRKRRW